MVIPSDLALAWLGVASVAAISNLDNLVVGVALGIRGSRVARTPNLIIAGVTMAGTAAALTSGRALSLVVPSWLASAFGALILIGIGAGTVLAAVSRKSDPAASKRSRSPSGVLSYREALALGVALSLNNVVSGVGAGLAGIPVLGTTLVAGLLSLLFTGGGSLAGRSVGRLVLGQRTPLLAGLLLIIVGGVTAAGVA